MYVKDKNNVLNLRISDDLSEYLYNLSVERGCTVSSCVRMIIAEHMIKNRGLTYGNK